MAATYNYNTVVGISTSTAQSLPMAGKKKDGGVARKRRVRRAIRMIVWDDE
jgi:hypothetical protein